MEIKASVSYERISPRKLRLLTYGLRGIEPQKALERLQTFPRRGKEVLTKLLKQGVANAVNNFNLKKDNLLIKKLEIGEGPVLKRGRPVSKGAWHQILKRTSHINLILEGK